MFIYTFNKDHTTVIIYKIPKCEFRIPDYNPLLYNLYVNNIYIFVDLTTKFVGLVGHNQHLLPNIAVDLTMDSCQSSKLKVNICDFQI